MERDVREIGKTIALKVCAIHVAQERSMLGLSNYMNLPYSLASGECRLLVLQVASLLFDYY